YGLDDVVGVESPRDVGVASQRRQRTRPLPVANVGCGKGLASLLPGRAAGSVDENQRSGFVIGQRPLQDAVDDAEDRRCRTDAERQRERRHGREARALREGAERETEVRHPAIIRPRPRGLPAAGSPACRTGPPALGREGPQPLDSGQQEIAMNFALCSRLALSILAVAAAAPTPARAQSDDPGLPETFTAFAVNMSGVGRTRAGTIEFTVERWSTDAERDKLRDTLVERGPDKLMDALQDIKPRTGYIRGPNTIGWDLYFARQFVKEDGSRRVIL